MKDQTLFEVIVMGGGVIGYIIWAISFVTVGLIIKYATAIRRTTILPELLREQVQGLFEEKQYREVIDATETEPSFLGYVIHASLVEAGHGYAAMERAMEEAAEERTTKMLRSLEWLNLIGNISPMLGLLGTVLGMLLMFLSFGEAGVDAESLGRNIGIALVTTLLGLSVAIPALAAYGIMRNRIDSLTSEAMVASQDLLASFRPAKQTA